MSRWISAHKGQDGFTLIEVVVALGILALVAVATLPLAIGAIRASEGAKLYTQAKNLVQQQVESMRNLQYHIDASSQKDGAGNPIPAAKLDLLDHYYPGTTPAAAGTTSVTTAAAGWVSSTTSRAAGEPATGSFYRWTTDRSLPGQPTSFHVVVDTQFLNPATSQSIDPYTGYQYSDTNGNDAPPSPVVGVTVIVTWSAYGTPKQQQSYTRIDSAAPQSPLTTSESRATALTITSQTDAQTGLEAIVATAAADGSSAVGSIPNSISSASASVNAEGAALSLTPGSNLSSPTNPATSGSAPQVSSVPSSTDANGIDLSSGCSIACTGRASTVGGPISVANGLPVVSNYAQPGGSQITASVVGNGNSTGATLKVDNNSTSSSLGRMPGPQVIMAGGGGAPSATSGVGLNTVGGSGHSVNAVASACFYTSPCPASGGSSSTTLDIVPTSFAPQGIVQVTLVRANLACSANGTTPSVTADYLAYVRYWSGDNYTTFTVQRSPGSSDPLPDPSTLTVGSYDGNTLHLSDFIQSWGSLVQETSSPSADGHSIRGSLGGIVSVVTQPTRDGDATSAISIQVGTLSCYALDNR